MRGIHNTAMKIRFSQPIFAAEMSPRVATSAGLEETCATRCCYEAVTQNAVVPAVGDLVAVGSAVEGDSAAVSF